MKIILTLLIISIFGCTGDKNYCICDKPGKGDFVLTNNTDGTLEVGCIGSPSSEKTFVPPGASFESVGFKKCSRK